MESLKPLPGLQTYQLLSERWLLLQMAVMKTRRSQLGQCLLHTLGKPSNENEILAVLVNKLALDFPL